MTIDPEFPKNHKAVGKHSTSDGDYTHLVWGQEEQMQNPLPTRMFKMHTEQEEKNMFH